MEQKLKIVFLGTPEFAVPPLEKLISSEFKPMAVFCAPDKPVGRQQILTPPPIKILAQKYNLPVFQPTNPRELVKQLETLNCDLIVSAAFGIIMPKAALELPRLGCLNIHPSLLPRWRGASPLQAAILAGDRKTGVTIIKMDAKVDHGPIVAQEEIAIDENRLTTPELSLKLSAAGANLLLKILPPWIEGKMKPQPQNETEATFCKIIKKEDGEIDWRRPAKEIERQIRAFFPWPGNFGEIDGQKIKIIRADFLSQDSGKEIREIFLDENKNIAVQTGQGYLILKIIKTEGGKEMPAEDFLRGHQNLIGQSFN